MSETPEIKLLGHMLTVELVKFLNHHIVNWRDAQIDNTSIGDAVFSALTNTTMNAIISIVPKEKIDDSLDLFILSLRSWHTRHTVEILKAVQDEASLAGKH